MTGTGSPVYLLNVGRGEQEAAELLDVIAEKQLADWEGEWVPELLRAMQRLKRAGIERRQWPQSRHWDWRKKTAALQQGILAQAGFSIVCDGLTQGMMIVDTTMKRCRIDNQRDKNLVYVKYVENAPWNRKELFNPPRYRGVGSILIRAAIALSEDLGFRGRLGLHSLPQADGFYADTCNMADIGIDRDYHNLRYFEMTPECAQAFIMKGGGTL